VTAKKALGRLRASDQSVPFTPEFLQLRGHHLRSQSPVSYVGAAARARDVGDTEPRPDRRGLPERDPRHLVVHHRIVGLCGAAPFQIPNATLSGEAVRGSRIIDTLDIRIIPHEGCGPRRVARRRRCRYRASSTTSVGSSRSGQTAAACQWRASCPRTGRGRARTRRPRCRTRMSGRSAGRPRS
jgi:hypothetical protein